MEDPRPVKQIYAFLTTDSDGMEDVLSITPDYVATPAMFDKVRAIARDVAADTGQTITLARFDIRTDLAELAPPRTAADAAGQNGAVH
jgi:hypothetical protein